VPNKSKSLHQSHRAFKDSAHRSTSQTNNVHSALVDKRNERSRRVLFLVKIRDWHTEDRFDDTVADPDGEPVCCRTEAEPFETQRYNANDGDEEEIYKKT
jgi:hypothetical protein